MSNTMTLNVRIGGSLKDYVTNEITYGDFDNISEYVRDLIRRDKEKAEGVAFDKLKAELQLAFSAPDSDYEALTADDIIGRMKQQLI